VESSEKKNRKVAIIGAGTSGLVALKSLRERGFSPDCFEMGDDVGGLWNFDNQNGRGGTYRSLHINTSTVEMEYSDFPMRTDIGHFPHHSHIREYFQSYVEHFQLKDAIRFRTRVEHAAPLSGGGYRLRTVNLETGGARDEDFDALIVANGHHFSPSFPEPNRSDSFDGLVTHSHQYVDPGSPDDLRDKDVIVVGMGNSAMDIACELSRVGGARSVKVSARRGAWVLPKFLRGKPIDQGTVIPTWLPGRLRRKVVTRSFELIAGKMSDFGLPQPDHLIGEAHPTVSSDFPHLVANGDIEMIGEILSCSGDRVSVRGDKSYRADAIIYCTGYKIEFPFFDSDHISAPGNELPLYHRAFHPEHRSVFFVGLMQTLGAVMPVAEAQARAIAAHLDDDYALPTEAEMRTAIEADHRAMKKRFVASKRHTMQVDPPAFYKRLRKDLIRGKRRATRGEGLPFRPRDPRP